MPEEWYAYGRINVLGKMVSFDVVTNNHILYRYGDKSNRDHHERDARIFAVKDRGSQDNRALYHLEFNRHFAKNDPD